MCLKPILRVVGLLTAAVFAACSPLSLALLDAVTPRSGYTRTADVAYAETPRQKLDVYTPNAPATTAPRPVVVFFYGGGWEIGRRERYRFVAKALTGEGFVTVVPDYRVYPDALFPDFIFDAAKAVRWTRDHIERFGGDPGRIFVMGHSAGAHIAAMLILDPRYLKSTAMAPGQLRGMIGLAGPYDFLPLKSERLRFIFGPESEHWRSQPINFVDGSNPAMLLVTGAADRTVLPGNTHRLAAKIRAHRGSVAVIEYAGVGHAELITGIAPSFPEGARVLKDAAAFVRAH